MRPKYLDPRAVGGKVLTVVALFVTAYVTGALMMATAALLSWEWTKRRRFRQF